MSDYRPLFTALILSAALGLTTPVAIAQEANSSVPGPEETAPDAEPELTTPSDDVPETITAAAGMLAVIMAIDEDARLTGNGATFTLEETTVTFVVDVNANRMRLFAQIAPSDALSGPQLRRLMQANFDTALDARYAIARGQLWSTFIHPLTSLSQDDFVSAIAQTVTLVKTYGTTYSSGGMSFGGGDSNAEIQKRLESLLNPEKDI